MNFTKKKLYQLFEDLLCCGIVAVILVLSLLPIVWLTGEAVKPPDEWMHDPPIWIPSRFYFFENLSFMWYEYSPWLAIRNTLVIGLCTTALSVAVGSLAAYSISRFNIGGNNFLFWILSNRMLPPITVAIPLLIMYGEIGLLNTHLGLILAYTVFNIPLVVWLMKAFFDEIPREIEESAMIDGCSTMTAFTRMVVPLSKSALLVTAIFCMIFSWNEFTLALVLTQSLEVYTLPIKFHMFRQSARLYWGPQALLALIAILPILVVGLAIQRHLARGLTFGAVKG